MRESANFLNLTPQQITNLFNNFAKDMNDKCLTDEHRRQFHNIMREIINNINNINLDTIALYCILNSLTKTKVFNKLWIDDQTICLEHKKLSIDFIDTILHKLLQNENHVKDKRQHCRELSSMFYTVALLSTSGDLVKNLPVNDLFSCLNKKLKVKILEINSQDISNIIWSLGKFVDVPELQKIVIVNKESLQLLLQQIAPHNRLSFISQGIIHK